MLAPIATHPTAPRIAIAESHAAPVTVAAPHPPRSEFHFIRPAARARHSRRCRAAAPSIESIAVPTGVSLLRVAADGTNPILVPFDPDGPAPAVPCVEPVTLLGRAVLLAAPGPAAMTVNGAPAATLTIIRPGDYVWWAGCSESYLLGLRLRPFVGPLPEALSGRRCGVCKGVPAVAARVWVCPNCDGPLHLEEGVDEPLECARLASECPACHSPVRLEEWWIGLPPEIAP